MYEKLFTRPACFLGNVVDKMTDDLSKYKNCLSIDPDSIAQRVVETYYARCSDKDFERIFKAYWKFVFQESSDSQIIGDRDLNFLVLRTLTRYDRFKFSEKLIKNGKIFDVTSSKDDALFYLTSFFEEFYTLYYFVPDSWKSIIDVYLNKNSDKKITSWYMSNPHDFIHGLKNGGFLPFPQTITQNSFKKIYAFYDTLGKKNDVLEFFIIFLGNAGNFVSVDAVFTNAIEPYVSQMNQTLFNELFATMNKNDQVYNNRNKSYMVGKVQRAYSSAFSSNVNLNQYHNLQ